MTTNHIVGQCHSFWTSVTTQTTTVVWPRWRQTSCHQKVQINATNRILQHLLSQVVSIIVPPKTLPAPSTRRKEYHRLGLLVMFVMAWFRSRVWPLMARFTQVRVLDIFCQHFQEKFEEKKTVLLLVGGYCLRKVSLHRTPSDSFSFKESWHEQRPLCKWNKI